MMFSRFPLMARVALCFLVLAPMFNSCKKAAIDYSITPALNPNKISPLTAMLDITTEKPCKATVKVLGDQPVVQSFETSGTALEIPVIGLYPNTLNDVEVTLDYDGGQIKEIVQIQTGHVPDYFPTITINTLDRDNMEPGWHLLDSHFANFGKFRSAPIMFDDKGVIRWYLDLSFHGSMVGPFQRLKDGTILAPGRHTLYEFDMLGKELKKNEISTNYGIHHEVLELPNEDLLIAIGKRDAFMTIDGKRIQSDSDFMMHYDRKQNKILKEWDLAKHLDVSKDDLNFFRDGDWLHMNALEFDSKDSTIIVSGRNQGLIKVSWDDTLKWIMSPKQNWGKSGREGKGYETKPYLLTAVNKDGKPYTNDVQNGQASADDFDFPWGPHAPLLMPNGDILVFDNGPFRNYNNDNNYSRAVAYKVDEDKMTVEQTWEYGKTRGTKLFSSIVSDVDYLPNTKNILMTSGFLHPKSNHSAKVVEVNPNTNKEVFEATIFFKDTNQGPKPGWGQSDVLYRSERMELKF